MKTDTRPGADRELSQAQADILVRHDVESPASASVRQELARIARWLLR
jgi:hypothetical protein